MPASRVEPEGEAILLAMDHLRLAVRPGEFVTLLGAAAAGKSTLLDTLSGARRVAAGRLTQGGRDLHRTPTHRRGFGILAQNDALFPQLTLAQNVAYPLARRGLGRRQARALVDAALDAVGLTAASRLPRQASAAERQRACIARATVFGPQILLLDEPLSHQDPAERQHLLAALRRLHLLLGAGTIMATRVAGDAMALSDRIVVLDRGQAVQSETPAALYDRPVSALAALACGEANLLPGIVRAIDEEDGIARVGLVCGPAVEGLAAGGAARARRVPRVSAPRTDRGRGDPGRRDERGRAGRDGAGGAASGRAGPAAPAVGQRPGGDGRAASRRRAARPAPGRGRGHRLATPPGACLRHQGQRLRMPNWWVPDPDGRATVAPVGSRPEPRMIELTDALIRATVTANAFAAGQAYMRNGRVRAVGVEPAKGTIRATVKGSAGAQYQLAISVRERDGLTVVDGECTCPVGHNCKHVAAVLFAQQQYGGIPAPPGAPKPAKPVLAAQAMPARALRAEARVLRAEVSPAPALAVQAPAAPALPGDLAAWLSDLSDGQEEDSEAYPANVSRRLFYMLDAGAHHGRGAPDLQVLLAAADLRHDGTIREHFTTPDAGRLPLMEPVPKYLRPSDRAILRRLNGTAIDHDRVDGGAALRDILATGRARIGAFPGTVARLGEMRAATLDWKLDEFGTQRPVLAVEGGGVAFLLAEPWYLDRETAEVGPIATPLATTLLRRLLNAPPIAFSQAGAVREALARTLAQVGSQAGVAMPREVPHGGEIAGTPVPHLRLVRLDLGHGLEPSRFGGAGAALSFRYGKVLVAAAAPPGPSERLVEGVRYTLRRNPAAEKRAAAMLHKLDFSPLNKIMRWGLPPQLAHCLVLQGQVANSQWLDFMLDTVPMLRGLGWEIVAAEDFPHRIIAADGPMDAELREGSGIDWFDLHLGVTVGEERIDLVPPLLKMLAGPQAAAIIADLSRGGDVPGRKLVVCAGRWPQPRPRHRRGARDTHHALRALQRGRRDRSRRQSRHLASRCRGCGGTRTRRARRQRGLARRRGAAYARAHVARTRRPNPRGRTRLVCGRIASLPATGGGLAAIPPPGGARGRAGR